MCSATEGTGEVSLFYWLTGWALCYVYISLHLILLIALKWRVTDSLIITPFPKLLIKIQETITSNSLTAMTAPVKHVLTVLAHTLTHSGVFLFVLLSVVGWVEFLSKQMSILLPFFPGTSSRTAFMFQGMLLSDKHRPIMFSTSTSFNSSMPIFTAANIKTLSSTSISCPPKLLGEQCVFSYPFCECDTSAQRHHCKKPTGESQHPSVTKMFLLLIS